MASREYYKGNHLLNKRSVLAVVMWRASEVTVIAEKMSVNFNVNVSVKEEEEEEKTQFPLKIKISLCVP